MIADPHPDVTVILKRTDRIIHRTPYELTDKDIKMKKREKNVGKTKRKRTSPLLLKSVLSGSKLSLLEIIFCSGTRDVNVLN